MKINVINTSNHPLPSYETTHAAAMDARAYLPSGSVTLKSLERMAIPTGLFMAIPEGYELQVRSRSGLSFKHGIVAINSPGTIDADYRGELKILVANLSNEPYEIQDGDRLVQLVVSKCERIEWEPAETLDETERGSGGFGHTGKR
jgi:dUTP pyrophosphatase